MTNHCIDGVWHTGGGPHMLTIDPANGTQTWHGHAACAAEVDQACRAARKAFPGWAGTALEQRIALCLRWRDLLSSRSELIAELIAREVGKPLWEARTEVASMVNKVDISIQAYHARSGTSNHRIADGEVVLRHRPHGVFGVFGPYNFPGHLPHGHIIPALISGNTVVFKASEYAPRTAIWLVGLWHEAGLPAGVLNLLNGAADTGAELSRHAGLDGILFTGSYQTGLLLHRQCAGQPEKMLALEMGGNNALVVWDTAHLDAAVHHTIISAFISAGQRCTCARRLIVSSAAVGQIFLDRLVEVAGQIRIGQFDQAPPPFMGPVVSEAVALKLLRAQADLVRRGGKALLSMTHLIEGTGFVSPAIIDVTAAVDVPDEEWFGPLLQVVRVDDFDAALVAANATSFGLAAGLLSDDPALWEKFLLRVRAGVVNWNRPTTGAVSTVPFGGVGHSGNHRPSAFYAADYCAYPAASIENAHLDMPAVLSPGLSF